MTQESGEELVRRIGLYLESRLNLYLETGTHGASTELRTLLSDTATYIETHLRSLHAEEWNRAIEQCARHFEGIAKIHAPQATWIGPERQYYKGPRIPGVEMSSMNGEAISYDREMAHAAAIRALKRTQDTEAGARTGSANNARAIGDESVGP